MHQNKSYPNAYHRTIKSVALGTMMDVRVALTPELLNYIRSHHPKQEVIFATHADVTRIAATRFG